MAKGNGMGGDWDLWAKQQELAELERRRKALRREIREKMDRTPDELRRCLEEAEAVQRGMDDWMVAEAAREKKPSEFPLCVRFLGACSGEWLARSRYRGTLPGFGGFLVEADGKRILVDPGRGTVDGLHEERILPRSLDCIVSTHAHWDCTRDLGLAIMAATGPAPDGSRLRNDRLRLLAGQSVISGFRMDAGALLRRLRRMGLLADEKRTRDEIEGFAYSQPAVVNSFDLFCRLGGRAEVLEIGRVYRVGPSVEIHARRSHHSETFGATSIPALDIVVRREGSVVARCVYLSDTEYRRDLAETYARHLEDLGPIDLLVCNVKTLRAFTRTEGEYRGFTKRHIGWRGVVQLTRDLQAAGALRRDSLVVLRAWGIETVTKVDEKDRTLVATPEKLGVYERAFAQKTGQRGIVPGRTFVCVSGGDEPPRVKHRVRPFPSAERPMQFGELFFWSRQMQQVVHEALAAMDSRCRVLLILGETGVGKDALAKAIHEAARRKDLRTGALVVENLAALEGALAWPLLAGNVKGSFTGAFEDRAGLFAQADQGTLVLDEFMEMDARTQGKLLTVLQEWEYREHGGRKVCPLTAKIIFTTNRDIHEAMEKAELKRDLWFRIQRTITIPPLRERPEDIVAALHGWYLAGRYPHDVLRAEVVDLLRGFTWSGNVRALKYTLNDVTVSGDWSLANIRACAEKRHPGGNGDVRACGAVGAADLEPLHRTILEILRAAPLSYRRQIEEALRGEDGGNGEDGPSKGALVNHLNRLARLGLLERTGGGPSTRYRLTARGRALSVAGDGTAAAGPTGR